MDFLKLLTEGAGVLKSEEFDRLMRDVVEWLVRGQKIDEDDIELATDALVDTINIHVATGGVGHIRKEIIAKARTSSDPSGTCLRELRKAVLSEVKRCRYADYRHRLYRQAKLSVRELEHQGVLQSWTKYPSPKKIGLKSWGPSWRKRAPKMSLRAIERHLPTISCYEGDPDKGNETDRQKESKIFNSCLLLSFIPTVCALYGGPLTISEIAAVVERKLSRPLYRFGKQTLLPEIPEDDRSGTAQMGNSRDLLTCSEFSWEEEFLAHDVLEKLKQDLTSDELEIMEGLSEGGSKRNLAKRLNCAPGTLETRRQELARKTARHDPCVRARLEYLKRRGAG